MHHASIRTANIHRAIAFYEQLGFTVSERFTTGYTLACWMEGLGGRIELIQIPQPRSAPDAFGDEHYVGYYHLSFDITDVTAELPSWLTDLQERFAEAQKNQPEQYQPLKVLLSPTQQQIGDRIYEVAFIADADGLPPGVYPASIKTFVNYGSLAHLSVGCEQRLSAVSEVNRQVLVAD